MCGFYTPSLSPAALVADWRGWSAVSSTYKHKFLLSELFSVPITFKTFLNAKDCNVSLKLHQKRRLDSTAHVSVTLWVQLGLGLIIHLAPYLTRSILEACLSDILNLTLIILTFLSWVLCFYHGWVGYMVQLFLFLAVLIVSVIISQRRAASAKLLKLSAWWNHKHCLEGPLSALAAMM